MHWYRHVQHAPIAVVTLYVFYDRMDTVELLIGALKGKQLRSTRAACQLDKLFLINGQGRRFGTC